MTGIITDPGKFEGEPTYVPYLWDTVLQGFADTDLSGGRAIMRPTDEDKAQFPALADVHAVLLWERTDGFICHDILSEFAAAVEEGADGMAYLSVGNSEECESCPVGIDEGFFSHSECDVCGSTLGGQRYAAHYIDQDEIDNPDYQGEGKVCHLDVCTDCLMYLANGDEPDTWEG